MTLSDFIEQERLTEADLARVVGCSQSTINRVKLGGCAPSMRLATGIMKATGGKVTPNDFAGISSAPKRDRT